MRVVMNYVCERPLQLSCVHTSWSCYCSCTYASSGRCPMGSSGRFASLPFGKSSGLKRLRRALSKRCWASNAEPRWRAPVGASAPPLETTPFIPTRTPPSSRTHGIIHDDPCYYASTATFSSFSPFSLHALMNKQHKAFVVFYSPTKVKPETRDPRLLRQAQRTHGGHTTTQTVPAIAIGSVFTYPGAGLVSVQASENCPLRSSQSQ